MNYDRVYDALEQWKFPTFSVGATRRKIAGGKKSIPTCNFGLV